MFIFEVKIILVYIRNTCLKSEITTLIRELSQHLKPVITQNYCVFELFPSSCILENRKHDVSETGSVSVLR
jgi:hypothetical protein